MAVFSDAMQNIGGAKIGALAAASILLIAGFIAVAFNMSGANMVPLYNNLSLTDSAKIISELEAANIPYELEAGGTQISVPSDRALRLRMTMAAEGLPSGGSIVGYEIFDRSETFGSSTFVMNVNMIRALEGELARTIGALAGVDNARVHLVVPKRELFARDKEKTSASVTIKMRGGQELQNSEVMAITHLVSSAVPDLQPSRVTVVDSHGRLLARGDGEDSLGTAAGTAQEMRITFENRMQSRLEELLEKVVGPGRVRVKIAADMNFDRVVINSEKYDPEGQVARSTQSTSQRETAQEKTGGGNTSVSTNIPSGAPGGEAGGNSNRVNEQTDETSNFEISKTVQNMVKQAGTVNRLSVAVLVDGVYDADGNYKERTEAELAKLRSLVSTAIGFDEKRGDTIELVNMPFSQSEEALGEGSFFQSMKAEMQSILQTLIIAVVAILAIFMVLRPAVNQLVKQGASPSQRLADELASLESSAGGDSMMRLPGGNGGGGMGLMMGGGGSSGGGSEPDTMIDVANVKGGMKSSSMKKIAEIVDKYPEETMGVLRQWIAK